MTDEQTQEERSFLRRWEAKQRRRRRTFWLIVLGTVALVILLPLLACVIYDRYWQGRLNAKVGALRAQGRLLTIQEMLNRDGDLPAGRNSALLCLDAFAQLTELPLENVTTVLGSWGEPGARPSAPTLDLLGREEEARAGVLKALLQAAALKQGRYPLSPASSPMAIRLDYLTPLRRCVRICGRMALLHAARGEPHAATPYLLAGFGLASSVGGKTFIIEGLVRIAAEAITVTSLERAVALCQFAPEDLRALQERMEQERDALSLGPAFVFERLSGQWCFDNVGSQPQLLAQMLSSQTPVTTLYNFVPGWRERDALFFHDMMDEVDRAEALPPRQALAAMRTLEAEYNARARDMFPPPVLTLASMPTFSRVLEEEVSARERLSVAAAALGAERYRLGNGRWPDSLEQLVPEFLDAVPEDYFGAGKVRCVRTDTGVLIYSIGRNGIDDGGVPRSEAGRSGADDLPFRLLDPELRGAKTTAFREEAVGVDLATFEAAGLDEEKLKGLGLTEDDLEKLP